MPAERTDAPHARGMRRDWLTLPRHIVEKIEHVLGGRVVSATSMSGGFSPGVAARITTESGATAFVKSVSATPNPIAPTFHRRECLVASSFPPDASLPIPRLLWSDDEGENGWVTLVFENINGHEPAQPWQQDELTLAIDALNLLATTLTPSPISPEIVGSASDWGPIHTNFWRFRMYEEPERLDPWSRRHLDGLAALSDAAPEAVAGSTLLHLDLRADNMLLADGRFVIVDWPHARVGAAWLDALFAAPSIAMHGGLEPEALISRIQSVREANPNAISAAIASIAGFFTSEALLPEVAGLPGLRHFQDAQGMVARQWLADRLGWD